MQLFEHNLMAHKIKFKKPDVQTRLSPELVGLSFQIEISSTLILYASETAFKVCMHNLTDLMHNACDSSSRFSFFAFLFFIHKVGQLFSVPPTICPQCLMCHQRDRMTGEKHRSDDRKFQARKRKMCFSDIDFQFFALETLSIGISTETKNQQIFKLSICCGMKPNVRYECWHFVS